MTATMVAQVIKESSLTWDTTLAEALPEIVDIMDVSHQDTTLDAHLAPLGEISHLTGPLTLKTSISGGHYTTCPPMRSARRPFVAVLPVLVPTVSAHSPTTTITSI